MTRRWLPCAVVAWAATGAAGILMGGCGSDEPETDDATAITQTAAQSPQRLAGAEVRVVERTQQEVIAYCQHVAEVVQTPGRVPAPQRFARVNAAIEELAGLAAEKPDAETPDGISARLALGDIAENLEGTNCDNRLVERINAELAEL